ncbi:MAG: SusD/RagB family nutrient-binding outer membrane lipoprotein [Chryseolinea sp.]
MKKKSILYILAGMAMVAISCNDFLDVNTNPNQPTSATPETVLANALNVTAGRLVHHEIGAFWVGQWSPSGSVSGFVPEKTYDIQTTFRTGIWTSPYNNLTDYQYVEQQALAQGKKSIAGMARVMKAFNYQILVDAYGNVPYSDALKGTVSIRPKYDDGKAVYDSLIRDLNVAITYLSEPISTENASAGSSDIYFGGNTAKWLKFAKTLKLRMLVRIQDAPGMQTLVATEMAKYTGDHTEFMTGTDDVKSNPGYLKTAGKENQWYETYGFQPTDSRAGNHDFYCWSDFFITSLEDLADPRLPLLAYQNGGAYVGVPFGEGSDTYLYSKISGFGPAFLPTDGGGGTVGASKLYKRSMVVMTAAESFFLQAEAVEAGLLTSDLSSQELFEAGIKASFDLTASQMDVATDLTTEYEDYIASGNEYADWNSSPNKLEAIIIQKWIALANHNGFEAWSEWRRTGIPDVPLSTRAQGSQQPIRFLYPLSEYSNNTENAQAQGTINQFTSKIFWVQ